MMLLAMLLMQATPIDPPKPAAESERKTIVVVGRRRRAAGEALANCIARNCPPNEEMAASLHKADTEFMEGDYFAGRKSMGSARRRNAKYAKQYPELVSELSRVDSRLASLLGMREQQFFSAFTAMDTLRKGLPEGDPRILMRRLEVGDAYLLSDIASTSQFDRSLGMYRDVARDAKRLGLTAIYGRALLRPAIMYGALATSRTFFRPAALQALDVIDATREPQLADVRDAAVMLRARLAMAGGSAEERASAIAALGRVTASTTLVAIEAPGVELGMPGRSTNSLRDLELAGNQLSALSTANVLPEVNIDKQWVDMSYWVNADGTVRDVDVVRQGDRTVSDWVPAVRKALVARRYAPLGGDANGPGLLRIERFSMVSDFKVRPGSWIRGRFDAPHVEAVDLSNSSLAKAIGQD